MISVLFKLWFWPFQQSHNLISISIIQLILIISSSKSMLFSGSCRKKWLCSPACCGWVCPMQLKHQSSPGLCAVLCDALCIRHKKLNGFYLKKTRQLKLSSVGMCVLFLHQRMRDIRTSTRTKYVSSESHKSFHRTFSWVSFAESFRIWPHYTVAVRLLSRTFDLFIEWMYLLSIWAKNEGKKYDRIFTKWEKSAPKTFRLCALLIAFVCRKYSYSVLNKFRKPTNSFRKKRRHMETARLKNSSR